MAKYKMHVLICGGTGCKSSNSLDIIENLRERPHCEDYA